MITTQTRRESYQTIKLTLSNRQKICIDALKSLGQATSRQVSVWLFEKSLIPVPERNMSHPRLKELVDKGLVEVVGKEYDQATKRNCAKYKLKEGFNDGQITLYDVL